MLMENEAIPVRLISFKVEKEEVSAGACKKFLKAKNLCGNFVAKVFVMKKYNVARAYFKLYQDAGKNVTQKRNKEKNLFKCIQWQKILLIILVKKFLLRHGQYFVYSPCYFKKLVDGTIVTVKQCSQDQFKKYVNSNGENCNQKVCEGKKCKKKQMFCFIFLMKILSYYTYLTLVEIY